MFSPLLIIMTLQSWENAIFLLFRVVINRYDEGSIGKILGGINQQ